LPKGRTTDQVAISKDWLPTLVAAAGVLPEVDESNTDTLTDDRTPDRPGAVPHGTKAVMRRRSRRRSPAVATAGSDGVLFLQGFRA